MLTLTTDFGTTEYVAQMKGVIYGVHRDARITDVSHEILPQNVLQGAFVLAASVPYFPDGTVHVGVVDPGVGSDRRALAIRCERGWLVGPDNGLLWPAAQRLGLVECREPTEPRFHRKEVSPTFHGRDVFAPVAAHLAADGAEAFEAMGPIVDDPIELAFDEAARQEEDRLVGVVLHVDRFGNVITNLPEEMTATLDDADRLRVRFEEDDPLVVRRVRTYAEAGPDEVVSLTSSSGFLEFAMNEDDAASHLDVRPGDAVVVRRK